MTNEEMLRALHDFKDVMQFECVGGWVPKYP